MIYTDVEHSCCDVVVVVALGSVLVFFIKASFTTEYVLVLALALNVCVPATMNAVSQMRTPLNVNKM